MNLRIRGERTPARRLAAVLRTYLNLFVDPPPHVPDYADIAHDIELYVNREEFRMRKEEIDLALGALVPVNGSANGDDAREYFRRRAQVIEALMHQNEQEIERSGILSLRRRTVTVIRRFFT